MDIFNSFATDSKVEVEGRWCRLSGDARVLVARALNENYVSLMKRLLKKSAFESGIDTKENEALALQITIQAMAETILLGWENLSFKGEEMAYSIENAKTLLGIEDFRKKINELAEERTGYLVAELEAQKNA